MSHIFIVHPEKVEVSPLRDALKSTNNRWELEHFEQTKDALAGLGKQECEVIILSGRFPDGALSELIATLRKDHPRVARIVAAEDKIQEYALRSQFTAHQFLSKPYSPDDLAGAVQRALSLRDFTRSKTVLKVVSSIKRLPALPENYQKLCELLKQDEVSIPELISVIGRDVAMVSKILQIANSGQFAQRRKPVSTVESGVKLLGVSNLKLLVLAVEVFSQLEERGTELSASQKLWDHSMRVSTLAGAIAERLQHDKQFTNEALSAGMLHDLGKLIFMKHFPEETKRVNQLIEEKGASCAAAELEIFGTTHAEVGGYLLGSWGLPHGIVEGVAYHHSPQSCFTKGITPLCAVYFANIMENSPETPVVPVLPPEAQTYLEQLGLESDYKSWGELRSEH